MQDLNFNAMVQTCDLDGILARRNDAIDKITRATALLDEAATLGCGEARDWFSPAHRRGLADLDLGDPSEPEARVERLKKRIDKGLWSELMNTSGLLTFFDQEAKRDWYNNLEEKKYPEFTRVNVEATFAQVHSNRGDIFERGVLNILKRLNHWDYKTNLPQKLREKIIIEYAVENCFGKLSWNHCGRSDQLSDLERAIFVLQGKPEPDHRVNICSRCAEAMAKGEKEYSDELFKVKFFKKGTVHVWIKANDVIDKINDIIAKHYPDALYAA